MSQNLNKVSNIHVDHWCVDRVNECEKMNAPFADCWSHSSVDLTQFLKLQNDDLIL